MTRTSTAAFTALFLTVGAVVVIALARFVNWVFGSDWGWAAAVVFFVIVFSAAYALDVITTVEEQKPDAPSSPE